MLNSQKIFLLDGLGALLSALVTGLVLPQFSDQLGLPRATLYFLAIFPVVYAVYSLSCHFIVENKRGWMLGVIVFGNALYCLVSGLVMVFTPTITLWGLIFLSLEILILIGVIVLEIKVYRNYS